MRPRRRRQAKSKKQIPVRGLCLSLQCLFPIVHVAKRSISRYTGLRCQTSRNSLRLHSLHFTTHRESMGTRKQVGTGEVGRIFAIFFCKKATYCVKLYSCRIHLQNVRISVCFAASEIPQFNWCFGY